MVVSTSQVPLVAPLLQLPSGWPPVPTPVCGPAHLCLLPTATQAGSSVDLPPKSGVPLPHPSPTSFKGEASFTGSFTRGCSWPISSATSHLDTPVRRILAAAQVHSRERLRSPAIFSGLTSPIRALGHPLHPGPRNALFCLIKAGVVLAAAAQGFGSRAVLLSSGLFPPNRPPVALPRHTWTRAQAGVPALAMASQHNPS